MKNLFCHPYWWWILLSRGACKALNVHPLMPWAATLRMPGSHLTSGEEGGRERTENGILVGSFLRRGA